MPMIKITLPVTEVILTCRNLKEKPGSMFDKEGYKVVYMDEASFNREFYLTDLVKMASGEPIYFNKEGLTSTIKCLNVSKVSGRHYNI